MFLAGRWKWTAMGIDSLFPRGIGLGDIDAFLEYEYCFLTIEAKEWDGTGQRPQIPTGQRLALQRKAAQPRNTVFVLLGQADSNWPRHLTIWGHGQPTEYDWADLPQEDALNAFRHVMAAWRLWAEQENNHAKETA